MAYIKYYELWVLGKKRTGKKRTGNKRTWKKRTGKKRTQKKTCCEGHWLAKFDTCIRLSTERTPANTNRCFRNKLILVVTYGKAPCFYFLEKALSLH